MDLQRMICETDGAALYQLSPAGKEPGFLVRETWENPLEASILPEIIREGREPWGDARGRSGFTQAAEDSREEKMYRDMTGRGCDDVLLPVLQFWRWDDRACALSRMPYGAAVLSDLIDSLEMQYGKGNIPIKIQACLLQRILEALEKLHTSGFLHLDLHPGTILYENVDISKLKENPEDPMDGIGPVRFLGFTKARRVIQNDSWDAIEKNRAVHTRGYTAPEQYYLRRSVFTPSTDLYSVAAVAFRMMLGHGVPASTALCEMEIEYAAEKMQELVPDEWIQSFFLCGLTENSDYRFENTLEMRKVISWIWADPMISQDSSSDYVDQLVAAAMQPQDVRNLISVYGEESLIGLNETGSAGSDIRSNQAIKKQLIGSDTDSFGETMERIRKEEEKTVKRGIPISNGIEHL